MSKQRYLLSSLAVLVFVFAYEWSFHGGLLKGIYEQTAHLWRSKSDCHMPVMIVAQVMFSFVFSFIFLKGYENKGIMEGVRYGALIGLLGIPSYLVFYAVQPLPAQLVVLWCVGWLIEMILAGAILAAVYKR